MSNHEPSDLRALPTAGSAPSNNESASAAHRWREIPPVASVVAQARQCGSTLADEVLTRAARAELELVRAAIQAGDAPSRDAIVQRVVEAILALEQPRLVPIINATGVIIHTNLGRAPVSAETAGAMAEAAAHAVTLEIEPASNERGGRMREIASLLRALTGAADAVVVNNGASAVLLVLAAVASGKSVVVSRGEAVEIGGGFRIPDVLRQSGARLVEVGTTNRTYVRDYAAATDGDTAAYLKVHPSNFRAFGFVHAPTSAELVLLARERGLPVLEDLGSGALLDTARFGLAPEPTLPGAIEAGVDLVMVSGDKLLGGPQAGIVIGSARWISRVARHPLARAVRADKTVLSGVAATLRHYARGEAETHIPVWQMITATEPTLRQRAERLVAALHEQGVTAEAESVVATIGGGSLPGETLPSWAVALPASDGVDSLARRLRTGQPAVFGRIERDRLLLDLRTVPPDDDDKLASAITAAAGNP
jgi:L-seryl-tRNA(Ser) seleniumtransferase